MVTDESPLRMLFRPDEIEMLVCGNKVRMSQQLGLLRKQKRML